MDKQEILNKLRDDENYYGEFGKQYLSNSDISALLNNPLDFKKQMPPSPALVVGGYFHTCILEPHKLDKYKVIKSSTRNTKLYKELSEGDICLLEHEADSIELMREIVLDNDLFKDLIQEGKVEYEVPGIVELEGMMWKGKADIVNHSHQLVIDLKTTSNINAFQSSAYKYNYDSQAYIYSKMFGYELIFIVIDKNSHQLGLFDCSDKFMHSGSNKVARAVQAYEEFFVNGDGDFSQYYISKTLELDLVIMARTKKQTCEVTSKTTSIKNFYSNQSHVKAVDNMRRLTGANKNQLRRMFNQLATY